MFAYDGNKVAGQSSPSFLFIYFLINHNLNLHTRIF
jgi:hypothetical protein